jgi:crotonobetaine/carnitine-CoA ligase
MSYHLDPRMPAPEACVQRYMLERWAAIQPGKLFAMFQDGSSWSYAETLSRAITTANAFRALGVKQGDRVLCWLPNSADCLRAWMGLNFLGAVFVPINLAYRGNILAHILKLADARLGVVHADLHQRLAEVDRAALEQIVVLGGEGRPIDGLTVHQAGRSTRKTRHRRRSSGRSCPGTCRRSSSPPERPAHQRG